MHTLQTAQVQDFQSIKNVSLEFGGLTVIVGPSNSGKSAFLRGIRACLRNTFNPSMVRQGTAKSVIDATFDDTHVRIERGKSLSTYSLGNGEYMFTKSARSVPDDVAKAIRFPLVEGIDATFAFQFDKPFLISESGSTAANVIGSLTNVSLLHAAVREANRRRQEATNLLKIRTGDAQKYRTQIENFRDLPSRKTVLSEAQEALVRAQDAEARLRDLTTAREAVEGAQSRLEALQAVAPPDVSNRLTQVEKLNARLDTVEKLCDLVRKSVTKIDKLSDSAVQLQAELEWAEQDYSDRLAALGACPTCGANTHKENHHA